MLVCITWESSFRVSILHAHALYPECSLADLYDPQTMPRELREANNKLDSTVVKLYGLSTKDTDEPSIVAALFERYQLLILKQT